MSVVVLDGEVSSVEDAHLPVHDRGFLFGDGVFETLRAGRRGPGALPAPVRLRAHVARLRGACVKVGIVPPSEDVLGRDVDAALAALAAPDARVRLVVTRGSSDWTARGRPASPSASASASRRFVFAWPADPPGPLRGVSATIAALGPVTSPVGVKSLSWAASIQALRVAHDRGFDEVITTTHDGLVLEAPTANVFLVRQAASGPELLTPPVDGGAGAYPLLLAGVARGRLLEGLSAQERPLRAADFLAASEVFLTSSFRGVVPVVELDGYEIGRRAVGPVTRHAAELLARD